jgi:hypothetical protein
VAGFVGHCRLDSGSRSGCFVKGLIPLALLLVGSVSVAADKPLLWQDFTVLEKQMVVLSYMHGVDDATNDVNVHECAQLAGTKYLDAVIKDIDKYLKEGKVTSPFEILDAEIGACIQSFKPKGGDPKSNGTSI